MKGSLDHASIDKIFSYVKSGVLSMDLYNNLMKIKNSKELFSIVRGYYNLDTLKRSNIFLYIMNNENFENKNTILDLYQRCFFKYVIFKGGIVSSTDIKKRFCERGKDAVCMMPLKRDRVAVDLKNWIVILKFANMHVYMLDPELYDEIFK